MPFDISVLYDGTNGANYILFIYYESYTRYDMDCIPYVDLLYKTKIIFRSIHKMRFLSFFIQMFLAISNIQAASVRLSDPR